MKRIDDAAGAAALEQFVREPGTTESSQVDYALAVRYGLQLLRDKAPGASVEVRVPPFGAAQAIEGPAHTRGTPPAVIEMEPATWLQLVTGGLQYDQAVASGAVRASGLRTDLQGILPLWPIGFDGGH